MTICSLLIGQVRRPGSGSDRGGLTTLRQESPEHKSFFGIWVIVVHLVHSHPTRLINRRATGTQQRFLPQAYFRCIIFPPQWKMPKPSNHNTPIDYFLHRSESFVKKQDLYAFDCIVS